MDTFRWGCSAWTVFESVEQANGCHRPEFWAREMLSMLENKSHPQSNINEYTMQLEDTVYG